jgi:hypothetical protein
MTRLVHMAPDPGLRFEEDRMALQGGHPFVCHGDQRQVIPSVVRLVEGGFEVVLRDDRERREGSVSLRRRHQVFEMSSVGHGFSVDCRPLEPAQVEWMINVLLPFNDGAVEHRRGLAVSADSQRRA